MMAERRLVEGVADRMTLGRRMRILRHRTARWFLPPVRPSGLEPDELPRARVLPLRRPNEN